MAPSVSIIVPCYNYGHLIKYTLTSLQTQSWQEWECIIVDDGSQDDTATVASAFCETDSRFKYIFQQNQGLSAARNTGIKAAQGNFIQFLDADDLLSVNKLQIQLAFMIDNPDVDISYSNAFYFADQQPEIKHKAFAIDENGRPVLKNTEWIPKFRKPGSQIIESLLSSNLAPVNSMLVKKQVFDRIGVFNTSYSSLEDWDLWARAALADLQFAFVDETDCHALIRVHTTSMTFNKKRMDLFYVKLQQDILKGIIANKSQEGQLLAKRAKKHVHSYLKTLLMQYGVFNINFLMELNKYLPLHTFLKVFTSVTFRIIKKRKNHA